MVFYSLESGECLAPLPCSTWASSKEAHCTQPRTTQVSAHAAPLPGDWWTLGPWIMFLRYLSEREGVVRGAALGTLMLTDGYGLPSALAPAREARRHGKSSA